MALLFIISSSVSGESVMSLMLTLGVEPVVFLKSSGNMVAQMDSNGPQAQASG